MPKELSVVGARDGQAVELPTNLDTIAIITEIGVIHIDLGQQVPNMVLMRSSSHAGGPGDTRLILSPMESGRIAVGVIRST
jgi:hypothetical protein